jgi:DNA-binding PadR family transcriptional regulator
MAPRLTSTSYCLLGLLHLRPWSAYDLTKYMQRSALAALWPRTEAAIYRESRRLADVGLATVTVEHTGDRSRTVYRITAAGRRALTSWLEEPGAGLRFECEAAVKAFFADAAGLESMRAQFAALVEGFDALTPRLDSMSAAWLTGDLRFPERIQFTAMSADLIARVQLAVREWAGEWLDRTEQWDGTAFDDAKRDEAQTVIADLRTRFADR